MENATLEKPTSEVFPHDLIIEILSWLPDISIMRFRCVSKLWHSLISDSTFITTHLHRSSLHDADHKKLRGFVVLVSGSLQIEKTCTLLCENKYAMEAKLELPSYFKSAQFNIIGSCKGVLGISIHFRHPGSRVYMWNPRIGVFKLLPHNLIPDYEPDYYADSYSLFGFGFCCSTNDYKVVKLTYHHKVKTSGKTSEVEVFSLSTNSWKRSEVIAPCHAFGEKSLPLNGHIHWMGRKWISNYQTITTHNIRDEFFGEITLPKYTLDVGYGYKIYVDVLKESLCLLVSPTSFGHGIPNFYIWVMTKYGVVESWVKQFSVPQEIPHERTLGLSANGDVLCGRGKENPRVGFVKDSVVVYKLENSQHDNAAEVFETSTFYHTATFMESLVLLDHKGKNSCFSSGILATGSS